MTEVVVINGYSEKKDIANAFARYLTGEFASELYLRTGKAACNIRANSDYANLDVFDAEYAKSVPLPKIIELENFWMEIEALFQRVWDGEDVETELSELDNTVRLFFME
jgi:maltose-binding protein MalE